MSTVTVRMKCVKTSKSEHWSKKEDGSPVYQHQIELSVTNTQDQKDPNYPYAQLSGGTTFPLHTINDDAAAQFEVGKDYMISIEQAK